MSYRVLTSWKVEKLLFPRLNSRGLPHTNVNLLSHHIPKTAGSSLRTAFEQQVGKHAVYGVYENTGAQAMSTGESIWVPSGAKILHGHYKPHQNHSVIFPHAMRAVWVRDPLERVWSLVGHLLALGEKHPHFKLLKSSMPRVNFNSQKNVVRELILQNAVDAFTHAYAHFFRSVSISHFSFVGSKHKYDESLTQLAELLDIQLKPFQINRRSSQSDMLPTSIKRLEMHLSQEYEIVSDYL
jgi:hypothetical protein